MISNKSVSNNTQQTGPQGQSVTRLKSSEGDLKVGITSRLRNVKRFFGKASIRIEPTARPIINSNSNIRDINLTNRSNSVSQQLTSNSSAGSERLGTPKTSPNKMASMASEQHTEALSNSHNLDEPQHKTLFIDSNGYKYVKPHKNENGYFLLDVNALKNEHSNKKISLVFKDGRTGRTSSSVIVKLDKIKQLPNDAKVLKIALNNSGNEKSIALESGDLRSNRILSRNNPIKALSRLIQQIRNPILSHDQEKTQQTLSLQDICSSTTLVDQNLKEEKLNGVEQPEAFWSIKTDLSSGKSINFNFPKNISTKAGADFARFVKNSTVFSSLVRLMPSIDIYLTNQNNPNEKNWSETLQPHFKTDGYMLPGEGRIVFHDPKTKTSEKNHNASLNAFAHEIGHVIAESIYRSTEPPENSAYRKACVNDGDHFSAYGRHNYEEDFAESIRCYLIKGEDFKKVNPNRYLAIEAILEKQGDYKTFTQSQIGFIEERLEI